MINATNMEPINLAASRGMWTRVNRHNPREKSVIDYILVDSITARTITEVIV